MQILFMVGTHHKSFTRLINWADQYQQSQPETRKVQVQYGTSAPPQQALGRENYTQAEMDQLAPELTAIVLPAGPSLMMEWVRRGFKPIIVPRDPALDEHIDEHQLKFAAGMEKTGLITLCHTYRELEQALEAICQDSTLGKADPTLLDKFDKERSVAQFSQLMQELLG